MKTLMLAFVLAQISTADVESYRDAGCATNSEMSRRSELLGRWSRAVTTGRAQPRKLMQAAQPRLAGDTIIIEADDLNAPLFEPFDLAGRSVTFEPVGNASYAVSVTELTYDAERGVASTLQAGTFRSHALQHFAFPFHGSTVREVHAHSNFAVTLRSTAATAAPFPQYTVLEAATLRFPVIAPLLVTQSEAQSTTVYIKETAQSLTITWTGTVNRGGGDLQAVLFANGTIRFSYRRSDTVRTGSVVVSAGLPQSGDARRLGSANDPAADQTSGSGLQDAMVDIRSVTVSRIAESDLLQIVIHVREPVDPHVLADSTRLVFTFEFDRPGSSAVGQLVVSRAGHTYFVLPTGSYVSSTAAWVDGDVITMHGLQSSLGIQPGSIPLHVSAARVSSGDVVTPSDTALLTVELDAPRRSIRSDISALDSSNAIEGPIVESFTLPVLNVDEVWHQAKQDFPLLDEEIDAVAIYQNFLTDLVLYAGAYSTGGNAGADGIGAPRGSSKRPRNPALLHMNAVGFGVNATVRSASRVLMHEFGHRWLFFARFVKNSRVRNDLRPAGAHPAEWVDTRAAFPVHNDFDSSVMGGTRFTDHRNGTFTTWPQYGAYGLSWLDLYLMGLAPPSEVPPLFFVDDTSPPLLPAYFPEPNVTVSGRREDVAIEQIIEALGPRFPAYPDTQRYFRIPVILVVDPQHDVAAADLERLLDYRAAFERDFRVATGGRAEAITGTELPASGRRRRAVRK